MVLNKKCKVSKFKINQNLKCTYLKIHQNVLFTLNHNIQNLKSHFLEQNISSIYLLILKTKNKSYETKKNMIFSRDIFTNFDKRQSTK